jgi:guanylate kinase
LEKVILFSAPSGAGKTTIVRHLLAKYEQLMFSVSATTRKKRDHEENGVDYYFLSVNDFKEKIESNAFLEYEEVYAGVFYGTLKSEIDRIWKMGKMVVFDVDVMGGKSLKKYFGEKALAVFVKPPSLQVLADRLALRNTETPESLKTRISKAEYELTFEKDFDVALVNNDLSSTFAAAERLIESFMAK